MILDRSGYFECSFKLQHHKNGVHLRCFITRDAQSSSTPFKQVSEAYSAFIMGAHSRTVEGGVNLVESSVGTTLEKSLDNDNMTPVEATYSSLIQQYLSVFCVDNATFLAERLVATSKNNHAYYLLALCHFRANSPQRARRVLEEAKEPTPAMLYLLAKCCADMQEYGPAEEALLHNVRAKFRQARTEDDKLDIDEWILSTSVSANAVCCECFYEHKVLKSFLKCICLHYSHVLCPMEQQACI